MYKNNRFIILIELSKRGQIKQDIVMLVNVNDIRNN